MAPCAISLENMRFSRRARVHLALRSPLTGVLFALELTHDTNALLPLLVATAFAHAFSVLVMKRSILTEKVARLSR